jgi:N-formylglutamate deformylase
LELDEMDVFHLMADEGPIVAAAIHSGHAVRSQVAELLALNESERLREEDPYTDELTSVVHTRIIGRRSRFELDLNRSRDQAIYLKPEHAWGLTVWRQELPQSVIEASLANYDLFYATVKTVLERLIHRHGRIVVLDLHSYNHCRDGRDCTPADPTGNPEVNVGTGSVDRATWGPLIERWMDDLRNFVGLGRPLDVRENVKFTGGHFSQWINATFPGKACAIAVEFKKTFMDEWTGELNRPHLAILQKALRSTLPGLRAALRDDLNTAAASSPQLLTSDL